MLVTLCGCADPGGQPGSGATDASAGSDLTPADVPALSDDEDVACSVLYVTGDPDEGEDAGAPCVPGRAEPCRCDTGREGIRTCGSRGRLGVCWCMEPTVLQYTEDPDAGIVVPPDASVVLPPRLVRPLSGMRVMSQRPALRWVLPPGLTRARVELCDDRACARPIGQQMVTGTYWRPPTPLRPGVVFWRVQGLADEGAVAWTSATWEFGVRHRDTHADTIGGPIKDFDGDGYDDAVLAGSRVLLMRGAPGGARRRPEPILISTSIFPGMAYGFLGDSLGAADFNGDGLADLALSHIDPVTTPPYGYEHYINIFQGGRGCPLNAAGVLRMPVYGRDWGTGRGIAVGDFNGDGFADVISAGQNVLSLYPGSPAGVTRVPTSHIRVPGSGWFGYHESTRLLGDVDQDGYADVGVGNFGMSDGDGQVQIFYGNPVGRLELRVQTIPSPHGGEFGRFVMGGDFDGDGYSDLMAANRALVYWYRGTLRGVVFEQFSAPFEAPDPGAPGDLDGDGLVEYVNAGSVTRVLNAAEFSRGPDVVFGILAPRAGFGAGYLDSPGDMDSDGYDDLVTSELVQSIGAVVFLFRGGTLDLTSPDLLWELETLVLHRAE